MQEYTKIASGAETIDLNLGDLVIARLTDGKKYTLDTATLEVTDKRKPEVTADTGTVTTNSIQVVSANAVDGEAGMPATINYSYYIKESLVENYDVAKYTGTETNYSFTGLTHKTSYDIKVTATDIAGNIGEKEIKNITTGTVPDGTTGDVQTGAITFGTLSWNNKKASVTVNKTTSDSLCIEYRVLDSANQEIRAYQTIANGGTIENLNLGDLVEVRLTDGINHGNEATIDVTDGKEPTVNGDTGTVTINSIQVVSVNAVDGEAGMPATINYSYYIKASTAEEYGTAKYTGTETSYNFTGLTRDTSYDIKIIATDVAGNTGEKELIGIKTNPNTAPQFTENSIKVARTASEMSIEAIGTDIDNEDITYTLEWGADTNYGKSKTAKVGSGAKATITFDNVAKTDNIYWRLSGSDGIGTTESKTGSSEYCSRSHSRNTNMYSMRWSFADLCNLWTA